jgi:hypothetical protein
VGQVETHTRSGGEITTGRKGNAITAWSQSTSGMGVLDLLGSHTEVAVAASYVEVRADKQDSSAIGTAKVTLLLNCLSEGGSTN